MLDAPRDGSDRSQDQGCKLNPVRQLASPAAPCPPSRSLHLIRSPISSCSQRCWDPPDRAGVQGERHRTLRKLTGTPVAQAVVQGWRMLAKDAHHLASRFVQRGRAGARGLCRSPAPTGCATGPRPDRAARAARCARRCWSRRSGAARGGPTAACRRRRWTASAGPCQWTRPIHVWRSPHIHAAEHVHDRGEELPAGVREQGPCGLRLEAFFGCQYYAAMRPAVPTTRKPVPPPGDGVGDAHPAAKGRPGPAGAGPRTERRTRRAISRPPPGRAPARCPSRHTSCAHCGGTSPRTAWHPTSASCG
jgi:hypothetical protein